MNYTNTIKISMNALKRNKFRAFLTMLGNPSSGWLQ